MTGVFALYNHIPDRIHSSKHREIFSCSERSKSTIKEEKKIIDKPGVLNISRANIVAQMAAIVLLLFRAFSFVVRTTCRIRKLLDSKGSLRPKDLLPDIPRSIIKDGDIYFFNFSDG
jgi:hypothetical protein